MVALGEDGLIQGLSKGNVYFDLSTSTPGLIRRIHENPGGLRRPAAA